MYSREEQRQKRKRCVNDNGGGSFVEPQPLNVQVKNLRRDMGQKRIGGGIVSNTIYVTHCQSEPQGTLKKFPRLSAVETLEVLDISLEKVKRVCPEFCEQEGKDAIIMKNDKGFTVNKAEHLDTKKPFCIHFMPRKEKSEPIRMGKHRHNEHRLAATEYTGRLETRQRGKMNQVRQLCSHKYLQTPSLRSSYTSFGHNSYVYVLNIPRCYMVVCGHA